MAANATYRKLLKDIDGLEQRLGDKAEPYVLRFRDPQNPTDEERAMLRNRKTPCIVGPYPVASLEEWLQRYAPEAVWLPKSTSGGIQ